MNESVVHTQEASQGREVDREDTRSAGIDLVRADEALETETTRTTTENTLPSKKRLFDRPLKVTLLIKTKNHPVCPSKQILIHL